MMPGVEEIHPQQVSSCIPMSSPPVYWTNQSWSPYVSLACPCSIDGRESVRPSKFIPPSHVQLSLLSFLTVYWVVFVLPSNRKHWLNMSFGVPIGSVWKCDSRRGAMAVAKRKTVSFQQLRSSLRLQGECFRLFCKSIFGSWAGVRKSYGLLSDLSRDTMKMIWTLRHSLTARDQDVT